MFKFNKNWQGLQGGYKSSQQFVRQKILTHPVLASSADMMVGIKSANQFLVEHKQMRAELLNLHIDDAHLNGDMKNSRLGLRRGWGLKVRSYCVVNKEVL